VNAVPEKQWMEGTKLMGTSVSGIHWRGRKADGGPITMCSKAVPERFGPIQQINSITSQILN